MDDLLAVLLLASVLLLKVGMDAVFKARSPKPKAASVLDVSEIEP